MSSIKFIEIKDENQYNRRSVIHNKKKEILNIITNGNVKVNGKKIKQDNNLITIKLKEHQKRMISEMMIKEDSKYRVSSTVNLGVLADKVGSGKSMVILSLIALKPTINSIPSNEAKYKLPNNMYFKNEYLDRSSILS